jgi:hypothetical protein
VCFGETEPNGNGVEIVYTYTKDDDGDIAIVVTGDELRSLKLVLRAFLYDHAEIETAGRVSFWLSVLQGPVPDETWYDEEDDDVA